MATNQALATTADDDLTPGELAFMESRGNNTDLLFQENNLPAPVAPAEPPAAPTPAVGSPPPQGSPAPPAALPETASPPLAPVDEIDDEADLEEPPQIDPKTNKPTKPRLVNFG